MKQNLIKIKLVLIIVALITLSNTQTSASTITATPSNYASFIPSLIPGDVLYLSPGNYTNSLNIYSVTGTALSPITITGSSLMTTFFDGKSGANTVSIKNSSYVIIKNLVIDGHSIPCTGDAIKAENGGSALFFAHHITIDGCDIKGYDGGNVSCDAQQHVGISTKCAAWDWVVKNNKIDNVGTGMYFGNSDGTQPFVNGIVEFNVITNTIGYNVEFKRQLDTVRNHFSGTNVNGKTIVRHNTFSKGANSSSTGGFQRPVVLFGYWPSVGVGVNDYYEAYGNLFYNNPVESMLQFTGNVNFYDNVIINHYAISSSFYNAILIRDHYGVQPKNIKIFHNTIWTKYSDGGIKLQNPNPSYSQYCYDNAVFNDVTPSTGVTGFTLALDNVTDSYTNAANYIQSASTTLSLTNMQPLVGQLTGTTTPSSIFSTYTDFNNDFNGCTYGWNYRGAYGATGAASPWQLQMNKKTLTTCGAATAISKINTTLNNNSVQVYPNPTSSNVNINFKDLQYDNLSIDILDVNGKLIDSFKCTSYVNNSIEINTSHLRNGLYIIILKSDNNIVANKKILKL